MESQLTHPHLLMHPLQAWVEDDDFDIEYHVRRSALASPGDERELGVLVSRLHSTQIDFTRPPWEVHFIEGLTGGRFAIYTKVHHALVDGFTAVKILGRSLSRDPEARDQPYFFSLKPTKRAKTPRPHEVAAQQDHGAGDRRRARSRSRGEHGHRCHQGGAQTRDREAARQRDHQQRQRAQHDPQRAHGSQPPVGDPAVRHGADQGTRRALRRHPERRRDGDLWRFADVFWYAEGLYDDLPALHASYFQTAVAVPFQPAGFRPLPVVREENDPSTDGDGGFPAEHDGGCEWWRSSRVVAVVARNGPGDVLVAREHRGTVVRAHARARGGGAFAGSAAHGR
ncbi:MAG: wax ester/triacylglycerol synthase domain-containing protein, partial [Nocardioides sp.]